MTFSLVQKERNIYFSKGEKLYSDRNLVETHRENREFRCSKNFRAEYSKEKMSAKKKRRKSIGTRIIKILKNVFIQIKINLVNIQLIFNWKLVWITIWSVAIHVKFIYFSGAFFENIFVYEKFSSFSKSFLEEMGIFGPSDGILTVCFL